MEKVLPPGILMKLEELRVAEQAEAVDDLPLDPELAGAKRLRLGRPGEKTGNDGDEKKQFRHSSGL
jgi:hypothetical protein